MKSSPVELRSNLILSKECGHRSRHCTPRLYSSGNRKTYTYDKLADTAPVISRAVMTQHARLHGKDPNAFPLLDTQTISVLPKLYVATAGCDPPRDDGGVFAAALEGKGVDVRRKEYRGFTSWVVVL